MTSDQTKKSRRRFGSVSGFWWITDRTTSGFRLLGMFEKSKSCSHLLFRRISVISRTVSVVAAAAAAVVVRVRCLGRYGSGERASLHIIMNSSLEFQPSGEATTTANLTSSLCH